MTAAVTAALFSAVVSGLVIRGLLPGVVAWVAFVPVMLSVFRFRSAARAALVAYTASLGLLAAAFEGAIPVLPWTFAVALLGGIPVYAFPGGVAALSAKYLSPGLAVWSFPVTWTAAEFVAGRRWLFGQYASPVALGYTQLDSPLLAFSAAAGVTGVTFAVLLLNAVVAYSLVIRSPWPLVSGMVVVAAGVGLSSGSHSLVRADAGLPAVSVVQPALDLELYEAAPRVAEARDFIVDRLLALSTSGGPADLVVWPEGAVPIGASLEDVGRLVGSRLGDVELLAGAVSERDDGRFNSAFYFQSGFSDWVFDKLAPVPIGEAGIRPGGRLVVAGMAGLLVAPLICLDSAYSVFSLRLARLGAELLVVLSDDSFARSMVTPELHLRTSIFRAVETGLPLVFASAAGPSAFVSPHGRVIGRSEIGLPSTLDAAVGPPASPTLFVRFGEWVGFVCVVTSVVLLGLIGVVRRRFAASVC